MKFKNLLLSSVMFLGLTTAEEANNQSDKKGDKVENVQPAAEANLSSDHSDDQSELADIESNNGFEAKLGVLGQFTSPHKSVGIQGTFGYSYESLAFGLLVTAMYNFLSEERKSDGKSCISLTPALFVGLREPELRHGIDLYGGVKFMFAEGKDKMQSVTLGTVARYYLMSQIAIFVQAGFDIVIAEKRNGYKSSNKGSALDHFAGVGIEVALS
jgi:hypothetical protein